MNLKNLSDTDLLEKTKNLVQKEREILTSVLHHLREIGRRRLFSTLGYSSLFEYGVKVLGYSEDQIYRRISAMRLLKDIPELEEKINSGSLTLSSLNLAQSLFKQEEKISHTPVLKEKKVEVLKKLEGKSARDVKKIILSLSSSSKTLIPEKMRQISEDLVELRFTANQELSGKIEKLKGLLAHSNPNITMAELIDKLCNLGLQKWDPSFEKVATFRKPRVNIKIKRIHTIPFEKDNSKSTKTTIPAATKKEVWSKSQGKCQICKSTFALQIDHRAPRALGGTNARENLRLLCRNCNQRAAIETLGIDLMGKYLES